MRWTSPILERNIPIPQAASKSKKPRQAKLPDPSPWFAFLRTMQVGDSFLTEYGKLGSVKTYAKKLNIEVFSQTDHTIRLSDFLTTAVRVWRIK